MRQDFSRQFFLLIVLLSITPFILFLGKNFLLTEFFTAKYFWLAIIYSLSFIFFSVCANYLSKKILFFILFFAYLSFLQFYFFDIQQFLKIYKDGSTRYYVLFFIVFISFIATLSSKSSIFSFVKQPTFKQGRKLPCIPNIWKWYLPHKRKTTPTYRRP